MDIKYRRSLVDEYINDDIKFHRCCLNNHLDATLQGRENFNSEEFFASVGSREIIAIFKAGEKYTPLDRAFDIYMPKTIQSGIYPLNTPGQLIEVAYTENFPTYTSHWALQGDITLVVNAEKQQYSGTIVMLFKDRQGEEFTCESEFCFSLAD
ncbi:hypothetical protein ASE98_10230 [Pseudomonas sp. Leaf48]|uniref:hypothetical protein n=1 Tax=Pseudomonas sp. Leaf48 TaxID=1736221 RepID=UPI000727AB6C|nr:hypothetical protein [Pseudomonas sp. Leaf48]KQN44048.1 hypothetical protein ASE98_10230 [Pseudomonas sp. Leaf48]